MPLQIERRVIKLVQLSLNASIGTTPAWLKRPGRTECRERWDQICNLYEALSGLELAEIMPSRETRRVDAVLITDTKTMILEVDEKQHFNQYRALTFDFYDHECPVAFSIEDWRKLSTAKKRLESGGFAKPKPPLFPEANGRHMQRAFRDALCDLLPPLYGFSPTLRISDSETKPWIWLPGASERMTRLLSTRL